MTKTFAERCHIAQQFLPEAQYKTMLTALHTEMLAKLAEQPAPAAPELIPVPDDEIEWPGGDRPVPADTEVVVKLRDGDRIPGRAGQFGWGHSKICGDDDCDIVAYRKVLAATPQTQPAPAAQQDQLTLDDLEVLKKAQRCLQWAIQTESFLQMVAPGGHSNEQRYSAAAEGLKDIYTKYSAAPQAQPAPASRKPLTYCPECARPNPVDGTACAHNIKENT